MVISLGHCKICNQLIIQNKNKTRKYCDKCHRTKRSKRVMEYRAKKDPNVKIGVGSGGNQKGKNNHMWKGGKAIYKKIYTKAYPERFCRICGCNNEELLVIHHLDRDRNNSNLDNLVELCKSCHKLIHDYLY